MTTFAYPALILTFHPNDSKQRDGIRNAGNIKSTGLNYGRNDILLKAIIVFIRHSSGVQKTKERNFNEA